MAIRKPNLSVKEARHLAMARNIALEKDAPLSPIDNHFSSMERTPQPIAEIDHSKDKLVQVFISAQFPADGISRSFSLLCRNYTKEKSLRMVLRKALDNYENLLSSGNFQTQPLEYAVQSDPDRSGFIQTSRMLPLPLVIRARAFFDPLGFESNRSFGRKLASAALAAFFALEEKRPSI